MATANRPWILAAAIVTLASAPRPSAAAPPASSKRASAGKRAARAGIRPRTTKRSPTPPKTAKPQRSTSREGTALVTAALLHYADRDGKTATDHQIRKSLDKVPGGRATAERLAKRIRAAPAARQKKLLGTKRRLVTEPTAPTRLAATIGRAVGSGVHQQHGLLEHGQELPPQGLLAPWDPEFEFGGWVVHSTEDADGEDELVVVIKQLNYKFETEKELSIPTSGAVEGLAPGSIERHVHPLELPPEMRLLTTAVGEADGNAQSLRAEIEVAFQLAAALAQDLPNTDGETVDTFAALLAYTEGMLQLANGGAAPSLKVTRTDRDHRRWLWVDSPKSAGNIDYKEAVHHQIGSGTYSLLLNVPSDHPKLPRVTVTFEELRMLDHEVAPTEHLRLAVKIGLSSARFSMPSGETSVQPMPVSRKMSSEWVAITVSGRLLGEPPKRKTWTNNKIGKHERKYFCGDYSASEIKDLEEDGYKNKGDCNPINRVLDFAPGAAKALELEYNPKTNEVRRQGKILPKGFTGTLVVSSGKHSGVKIRSKIRITDDDAAGSNPTATRTNLLRPAGID